MQFEIKTIKHVQAELAAFCRFLTEQNVSQSGVFDCRLVASELVGNVFKHGNGGAILQAVCNGGCVELTVRSQNPFMPQNTPSCPSVWEEHGRGLFLVNSVCEKWCEVDGGVKVRILVSDATEK